MEKYKTQKQNKLKYILFYFTLYAFLGWLMETVYAYFILGHFVKRGFLFGPLCPIYGFGGVILYACLGKYKKEPIKLFFYSIIIFSVFEYISSFILDAAFQDRWWDYSYDFLNLNGRISLLYSLAWGIIALIFINFIHPLIEKIVNKILKIIPYLLKNILLYLIIIAVVTDFTCSCLHYLGIL